MKFFKQLLKRQAALVTAGLLSTFTAHAGPYILAGTDADEHGTA